MMNRPCAFAHIQIIRMTDRLCDITLRLANRINHSMPMRNIRRNRRRKCASRAMRILGHKPRRFKHLNPAIIRIHIKAYLTRAMPTFKQHTACPQAKQISRRLNRIINLASRQYRRLMDIRCNHIRKRNKHLLKRINRVIRDIPSTNVVEGNKRTSLRQDVLVELTRRGVRCQCVRCREVRGATIAPEVLRLDDLVYPVGAAEEHFISFVTPDDRLAGFLRLSLPGADSPETGLADLQGAALIREVHVYGQALAVGAESAGAAQHIGLGTRLLAQAEEIARAHGFQKLAVIAAVGTRRYYLQRGFERGELYLVKQVAVRFTFCMGNLRGLRGKFGRPK